jgi:hypothetical protein
VKDERLDGEPVDCRVEPLTNALTVHDTRLARIVERMGADTALNATSREERLRRVQDAWVRDLSPRSLAATSRELEAAPVCFATELDADRPR